MPAKLLCEEEHAPGTIQIGAIWLHRSAWVIRDGIRREEQRK